MLRQHATYRITRGGVMTCYRFSRWRPLWRNFTFGLGLGDVTFFRRSVSISIPNFCRHISNHGWDITSSVLEKNVHHIGILLPVSISVTSPQSACYFASGFRISFKSDHLLRKYDMSIFQDGDRGRSILLPVSICWCHCLQKVSKPNFVDISQFVAEI